MQPLFIRLFIFSIVMFTITGCNNKPEQTLRLAHITWPGYEALSLAKNRGLYKNLNVITYRPANNFQARLAFKNNIVDVIALTLTHAIEVQNLSSEPLVIIAVLDVSHGGDVIIANKNIKSIKELAGKRVAIEPSAFGAYFLSRAIDSSPELSLNQLQIVPINIEKHHKTFLDNRVDAIATYEPEKTKILKQRGHVIFDSSRIPNEIIDVLVTRSSFAQKNPQALADLLDGYFKALEVLKKDSESAILEIAGYQGISAAEFKQSLTGIHIPDREENKKLLSGKNHN